MSLKHSAHVIVGCLFISELPTVRRSNCSSHSCALPAQQQQSGPDISQLSPELQSQWDHEKNAHLGSIVIKPQSNRRVPWICRKCPAGHPHMWQASVQNRTHGRGCPFCSGHKVCHHNAFPSTAPQVALDWDTAKNSDSPHDYTASSHHRAHWVCRSCGHEWQANIKQRVKGRTGCPACAITQRRRLPTVTASSSSRKQYWDSLRNAEQGLDPDVITLGSSRIANFVCNKCPQLQAHKWTARLDSVFRGRGCPYCSAQRVCVCNSLQTLRPDNAAEWCYALNAGTPQDYTAQSREEVWWQNDKRGRWKERIDTRFYSTCNPQVCTTVCFVCMVPCVQFNQAGNSTMKVSNV